MKLESCPKIANEKCETPENTVKRLESSIGSKYSYDYTEERISEHLYWSNLYIEELDIQSMGKGVSSLYCRASALAECAEWSSVRDITRLPGYVHAHQDEVENALGIEQLLPHISTVTPETLGKIKSLDIAQHWVDAESILSGKKLKVPLRYINGISGTNGLAAGNRFEEALCQATNEIFERRAVITVLKGRMIMPTIDIESIDNPVIREHIDIIRSRNIEVYIKDLSFGGALPCTGVYFLNRNMPEDLQVHHLFKVGSSFNRETALMRAFTEYVQGRRIDELDGAPSKDHELIKCLDDNHVHFLSTFMFGYVPYANADYLKEGDLVPFDRGEVFDDFLYDIEKAKSIFQMLGLDYMALDLTDPDIGFPVVCVVAPGYSDILPYHPVSSNVLFEGWSREEAVGYI